MKVQNTFTGRYSHFYNTGENNRKSQQNVSFMGYDARPLDCVLMTVNDCSDSLEIIKEMQQIGEKDGFRVGFTNQTKNVYFNFDMIKEFFKYCSSLIFYTKWAQDEAILTPKNNIITHPDLTEVGIAKALASLTHGDYKESDDFIAGGNLYFIKNGEKTELLVGKNDVKNKDLNSIKKLYDVDKVIVLPQCDYHIDLFVRPLKDKKILVADDALTVLEINRAIENIEQYKNSEECSLEELSELKVLEKRLEDLSLSIKDSMEINPAADTSEAIEILEANGFTPIRVPARIYQVHDIFHTLVAKMNYINAVVHEKNDGSLTYITNKSTLNENFGITPEISEKIDFDFEKMFVKYLEPYVEKGDVHFISGHGRVPYLLQKEAGGIHCLCSEIPKNV